MNNQGFGPNGIVKNSNAAEMQAEISDVKKKSGFSNAQSAGAKLSPAAQIQSNIGDVNKGSGFSKAQKWSIYSNFLLDTTHICFMCFLFLCN